MMVNERSALIALLLVALAGCAADDGAEPDGPVRRPDLPVSGWEAGLPEADRPPLAHDARMAKLFGGNGPWREETTVPGRPSGNAQEIWEVTRYPVDVPPTPGQQAAADDLVERCFEAAERHNWFDYGTGIADGYKLAFSDDVHYVKKEFVVDEHILDPDRPEVLMYYPTPTGKKLLGFMFLVREAQEQGPQAGGPLTLWHYHVWPYPFCLYEEMLLAGFPDENGACLTEEQGGIAGDPPAHWRPKVPGAPPGCYPQPECADSAVATTRSPEMLHVWLVDHPEGVFSSRMKLDPRHVVELTRRRLEERGY